MKAFAREWNFNIVTRSPNYPRSNGLGEKAVGIAKKMVKQSMDTNKDMYSMLMEYRNCPLKHIGLSPEFSRMCKHIGLSPAQILFSRMCKTKLPVTAELLMPKIHPDVREKLKKRQEYGQKYYNQGTKQLKELEEGKNEEGNLIRRNRVDLKSSRNSPSIKAGIHSEPSDDSGNESKMNDVSNTPTSNDNTTNTDQAAGLANESKMNDVSNTPTSNDNTTNTDQAAGLANNMNPNITVTEKTYVTRSGRTVKQPQSLGDYHLA
ncbi:hypothetical protein QE152_g35068 [Popillia japonica]|uniref:Integrase catalytic domain-containing protein n=1 Tax=Popillia japonica TaxID=7064 RepID=A0AAW1IRP9_POPJA